MKGKKNSPEKRITVSFVYWFTEIIRNTESPWLGSLKKRLPWRVALQLFQHAIDDELDSDNEF